MIEDSPPGYNVIFLVLTAISLLITQMLFNNQMWQVGKVIRFNYQENKLNIELYQTITLQFQ